MSQEHGYVYLLTFNSDYTKRGCMCSLLTVVRHIVVVCASFCILWLCTFVVACARFSIYYLHTLYNRDTEAVWLQLLVYRRISEVLVNLQAGLT